MHHDVVYHVLLNSVYGSTCAPCVLGQCIRASPIARHLIVYFNSSSTLATHTYHINSQRFLFDDTTFIYNDFFVYSVSIYVAGQVAVNGDVLYVCFHLFSVFYDDGNTEGSTKRYGLYRRVRERADEPSTITTPSKGATSSINGSSSKDNDSSSN